MKRMDSKLIGFPLIFISYRREDSDYQAGFLYDLLEEEFGKESVFMDVDSLHPGEDFPQALEEGIGTCKVVIVLIGDGWLNASKNGKRRLYDPEDFVRHEIRTALNKGLHVIPVLIKNAQIPKVSELPSDIRQLVARQATRIRPGQDFRKDVKRLFKSIRLHLEEIGLHIYANKLDTEVTLDKTLSKFKLDNPEGSDFGKSELTGNLAHVNGFGAEPVIAKSIVVFLTCPATNGIETGPSFLKSASKTLNFSNWTNAGTGTPQPKYWARKIFMLPDDRRASNNSFVWEDGQIPNENVKFARLIVTKDGEIGYASSQYFVYILNNGIVVFRIGKILAELWKFSCLVTQVYKDAGYNGKVDLCFALINAKGSHLGDLADRWFEPTGGDYWHDVKTYKTNLTTYSENVRLITQFSISELKLNIQPGYITSLSQQISLAFNQDEPRFLEKANGLIPEKYF